MPCGVEALQLYFNGGNLRRVQEVTQLRVTNQVTQLRLIDRQRLRAAFGQRRVTVVEEIGDVPEHQRCGKRRWGVGVHHRQRDCALPQLQQGVHQCRHVEDVPQAFAVRLEQHGKRSKTCGHGEQVAGLFALLPERRAHAGAPFGQQQRPSGVLTEPCRKQRRAPQLPDHQ